jgi:signal transduction histidine kinase
LEDGIGTVHADPGKLRQVLFNYLSNALKFTPDGGSVCVRITRVDARHYCISVEDSGIGISAEDLPRLFTEFGQLGPSERAQVGTGLGLAITKRIVEAQGGNVGVESVFGAGSRFYAVLPGLSDN